jgi:hypothetical protein
MDTLTPDQRRLIMFGQNPERFAVALARTRKAFIGRNVVMAQVAPGGARLDGDDDDAGLFAQIDDDATAADIAKIAREHLDKFLGAPEEKDGHESLARCAALCAAALSRCSRDNANVRRISGGRGLAA